jgi:signal transduction histidine kinase/CheY-like chemotaxis protein
MSIDDSSTLDFTGQLRRLRRENKRLGYELSVANRQVPHLRHMIESSPDGIALLDADGTIAEHNTSLSAILGASEHLLIDLNLPELLNSLRRTASPEPILGADRLTSALSSPLTLLVELRHGVVEFRISGWVDNEGCHFVLAARPMISQNTRERELLQARKHIQTLDENLLQQRKQDEAARMDSLATLASTMVHDLNNALTVVLSNIELLREELETGYHEELIDDACAGTGRVQELVHRLRSFSLGPSLMLQPLCLTTWIPSFLRPIVNGLRASLELALDAEPIWVTADENQFAQVLLNLVTNGTQAASEAGIEPQITIRITKFPHGYLTGDLVRPVADGTVPHAIVVVEDNGPGIPPDVFRRLFTPFHTTKVRGSGLGLASVGRITTLHRGGIAVENMPQGGARFTMAFPLQPASSSQPAEGTNQQPETPHGPELAGVEVIVMEDDPRVQVVLARILEAGGAAVTGTACGEELLAAYSIARQRGSSPVCILDIHIEQGMGGIATIQEIIARWPDAIAMACTGYAEVHSTDQFRELGFRDWVFKPFQASYLRQTVRGLVHAAEPRD